MTDKPSYRELLQRNHDWAVTRKAQDPDFFHRLAAQQTPEYLWIGCSDARVPANEVVNLNPGELFVHRNIANQVMATDFNCLSVVQYAVEVLKVKHIIVCGHYGCGGVQAAMGHQEFGLVDNWLRNIKDVYFRNRHGLDELRFRDQRLNRLCELNVMEQVINLAKTKIVQHAWLREQSLSIHGWIYSITDGLVKDLGVTMSGIKAIHEVYHMSPTEAASRPTIGGDFTKGLPSDG